MPLAQGNLLNGRYRIMEVLGHGGMGSVYRAHDESLSVDVAVKENLFTTEDYARQFRLEATILASLRHPNLPRVSDHFVMPDEGQYLVMDYIEGPDLRQILEKNGPITEEEGIRIGAAICDALTFLHTRKPAVLHRDIKLGNIKLVPDGHICLVDFGLAKIIDGDQPTMTGARAMTPGYSPPEQYGSSRTDARSDVYSLGATLYAALTGFIPEDSLARALDGLELTPIRKRNPKISERVAAVIEKAMQPVAANRYQSAREFKDALLDTVTPSQPAPTTDSQPVQPGSPPPIVSPEKPIRKFRSRPFVFFSIILLTALIGLFYTTPGILPFQAADVASETATVTSTNSPEPDAVSPGTSTPADSASPTASPTAVKTATKLPTAPSATIPPVPMATPLGGGVGKIVFVTTREGSPQIYTMNPDGSQQERLFVASDGACQPKWSPDGTKLAYITPCQDRQAEYRNASIRIYDLQTGENQSLPSQPGGDFDPSWSPDGQSIVFTSLREGMPLNPYAQIFKIGLADQEATRLTTTDASQPARQPSWSPDGTTILYSLNRRSLWQLWSMSVNGENPIQILRSGEANDTQPTWAHDGLSIYFAQSGKGQNDPARLMQYTLGQETVTNLLTSIPLPEVSLSPDGNWLIAEGADGKNIDIYLFDLISKQLSPLTNDPAKDFDPHWQP